MLMKSLLVPWWLSGFRIWHYDCCGEISCLAWELLNLHTAGMDKKKIVYFGVHAVVQWVENPTAVALVAAEALIQSAG